MKMESAFIEERKTPAGYRIRVDVSTYEFFVYNEKGKLETPRSSNWKPGTPNKVPRIVFLGLEFGLDHFILGELTFLNTRDGKMIVPYKYEKEPKTILLPVSTLADVTPAIFYRYGFSKEIVKASETGLEFKHVIVDESLPKSELINLKVRYPKLNVFIQKKRISLLK